MVPARASRRAPAPCNAEWQTCFATCSRLPQKHLTVLRLRTAAHRRLLTLRPEAPHTLAACRSSRLRLLTFAWRNCFGPRCCDAAPADSLDSPRQRVHYIIFPHFSRTFSFWTEAGARGTHENSCACSPIAGTFVLLQAAKMRSGTSHRLQWYPLRPLCCRGTSVE